MQTDCEFKIAVCDDNQMSREYNAIMAQRIMQQAGIEHNICRYESGKTLLADIQKGIQFHVLLLDVMMDEMDGMELAVELRQQRNSVDIIFISGDRETVFRGYEVSALRYLPKPVEPDKLREALMCCYNRYQEKKEIVLPTAQGVQKVLVSDIKYVEAFSRGTRFVLQGETIDSRLKFSEVVEFLSKMNFVHCHRAYVVNPADIKFIRNYEFELKCGSIVPISKGRYNDIYKSFLSYTTG